MHRTAELAGFFAAHGIWCVSDKGPLIPLLGQEKADGTRQIFRFVDVPLEEGVRQGRRLLAQNPDSAARAVLVYDGFINLEPGKTDALFVEAESFVEPCFSFAMAVPYRSADDPDGFAVFRPKFLSLSGQEPDYKGLNTAFFRGVEQHEQGSAVWSRFIDESI